MDLGDGGWIIAQLASAGDDYVYRTCPNESNDGIIRGGDQARYFNHISSDAFTEAEFYHNADSTFPNMQTQSVSYFNPATGSNFTDEQLTALRDWVTELSPDTLMVAGSVDDADQSGGHGHEIFISDG